MLSGKLIYLIEAHQEEIAANVLREIRTHPDLGRLRKLSDAELRERGQQILENLGYWLSAGNIAEIEQQYEMVGRTRFTQDIPLSQSVRALALIKDKMIDFVHYQGIARNSLELYAEEELERRVGHFFDELTIHMVRGYETAWRRAAHAAA